MNSPTAICTLERRRQRVRGAKGLFGLDYVEVDYPNPNQPLTPVLTVYFLGRAPTQGQQHGQLSELNVQITGGQRVRDIQVRSIKVHRQEDETQDDYMEIRVDQTGDFSTYTLSLVGLDKDNRPTGKPMAGFDPRYASVSFSFKAGCPTDLDCQNPAACPPPKRVEPEINYLAKDYATFRQLILDRLALLMPDWQERHVPDIGIMLVEVLAYVGDYLSYYQDAVATEAYLDTARLRISVRRHARLVDYLMHEGCNARAWICLQTDSTVVLDPTSVAFISGIENFPLLEKKLNLKSDDLRGLPSDSYQVFEPLTDSKTAITLVADHGEIRFYTWGNALCCLPTGATRATLIDGWVAPPQIDLKEKEQAANHKKAAQPLGRKLQLREGDVLIFEEVKGPKTGNPADADPSRRWPVRLTRVTLTEDGLIPGQDGRPTPLVEIEWAPQDALPFPFCLSSRLPAPDCSIVYDVTVVRGNVILVDHGQTLDPEFIGQVEEIDETGECACDGSVVEMTVVPDVFRPPPLKRSPLTFRAPPTVRYPTLQMLEQNPRHALPQLYLDSVPPGPDGSAPLFTIDDLKNPVRLAKSVLNRAEPGTKFLFDLLSSSTRTQLTQWDGTSALPQTFVDEVNALLTRWVPRRDLLNSNSNDHHFVVEMDDERSACLRFGDGVCGKQPTAGTGFVGHYRIGNGTAGNVGAESITGILFHNVSTTGIVGVRNPFAAQGGIEPEPIAEVKLFAPRSFDKILERAVTAADYGAIGGRNQKLQQANARLRWTGSWYEAQVAVDPLGSEIADEDLLEAVEHYLQRYRRLGHDLAIDTAQYVALQIEMVICVLPQYLRAHVESALLDVFSNRVLSDGRLGFFHPDNLMFGKSIYLSRLIAAAQAVPGVENVTIKTCHRLFEPPNGEIESGILALGNMEIAQLDNDPSFPEHGTLKFTMKGGR